MDLLELAKRTLAEITGKSEDPENVVTRLPFYPDDSNLVRARFVLNGAGVRKIVLDGALVIGVWSDLDSPDIRAALRVLGADRLPVHYLDANGIPVLYRLRQVEGEPVPMRVLAEMERHPAEPWTARDRMLTEIGWCSKGVAEAEWKARTLNRLFQ